MPPNDSSSEWEEDNDFDDMSFDPPTPQRFGTPRAVTSPTGGYTPLSRDDIATEQSKRVSSLRDLLGIVEDEAFILLIKFGWQVSVVQERWFEKGEQSMRKEAGLPLRSIWSIDHRKRAGEFSPGRSRSRSRTSTPCPVCMEQSDSRVNCCGEESHGICSDCWGGFLSSKVSEGRAALSATCPGAPKCSVLIPRSFFDKFLSSSDLKDRFQVFAISAFVEDNLRVKWCPNPEGCEFAIKADNLLNDKAVICHCGSVSCFECLRESHIPVSCEEALKWDQKNSSESENVTWILAHTKNCPHCSKPIEKNHGCNHMHCPKNSGGCGHHFCWICLKAWTTHQGDPYSCNIYQASADIQEKEAGRETAKNELNRYIFFYERFTGHEKAGKIAKRELDGLETKSQILHDHFGFSVVELQFLSDAMRQVIECRRVLRWSYVYGFYLSDSSIVQKGLFEHLQKNLEQFTDRLHEYIEKDFDASCLELTSDAANLLNGASGLTKEKETTKVTKSSLSDRVFPSSAVTTIDKAKNSLPLEYDAEALRHRFADFRAIVTNYYSVTAKFRQQIIEDLTSEQGLLAGAAPLKTNGLAIRK